MTNREYMINLLLDGLESRLNRVSIDDGGASEEAMIYYKTLYLIFDYPYKYYTFKLFEV